MSSINKGERAELKSIVRQQFRVLRAELDQREREMGAELEDQITERFSTDDQTWSVMMHEVHEAVLACNRAINDAIYKHGYSKRGNTEQSWVQTPTMRQPDQPRTQLRIAARTKITAQVRAARLDLDRREADLLRTLAVGALESEDAHAFLSGIPTVGELVPAQRLAELEASLKRDEDPT